MAQQPIDRSKAKHFIKTSVRTIPALINRSNKTIALELAPRHKATASRFGCSWFPGMQSQWW